MAANFTGSGASIATSPAATPAPATTPTAATTPTTTSDPTSEPTTSTTSTSSTSSTSESTSTSSTLPTTSSTSTSSSSSSTELTTSTTSTKPSTTATPVVTTIVSTQTPTGGGAAGATTIVITSTASSDTQTQATGSSTGSAAGSAATGSGATISNKHSGGLSPGGTIAVAVVVPVVSVALIILGLLFLWKKRKARKQAEEERRKEVEEYGFNPNNDPSLPPMGMANNYGEDDNSGYRGWGTTSNARKASTNLSSGAGIGLAMSEGDSGAGYHQATPSDGTIQYSDDRPHSDDSVAALGAVPASNNRNPDIHRGPSNASSAYSAAQRSEGSEDSRIAGVTPAANYYDDNPYYNEVNAQQGPYGDNPYGGNPPVIRDVQARRNTRIENPSVFPKQGNAGIAQNF
ncbi:hypothetical protein Plec18170_007656 [Paecilomyces lecythidis]